MRSQLAEIYTRVNAMVDQVRTLPQEEYDLFLDLLLPEPQEAKPKKTRKKREAKSKPASGMAEAIKKSLTPQREGACTHALENGAVCGTGDNNPIHDRGMGYGGYHPFESAKSASKKSSAPRESVAAA